jgi:hypothetical protein
MADKYAHRKLVRNPNTGKVDVVFADADTGEIITNTDGYEILQSNGFMNLEDLGIDPVQTPSDEPTVSQNIVTQNVVNEPRGEAAYSIGGESGYSRNPSNNFGYFDRPSFMTAASFMPGTLGLAAKAANLGISMNQEAAANAARRSAGIEDTRSVGGRFVDTVRGNDGYIADIQYTDGQNRQRTTPVSFKAEDPVGRTALTPNEARMRTMLNSAETAPQPDIKQVRSAFQSTNPDTLTSSQGILSRAFSGLRSATANVMNSILGTDNTNYIGVNSFPARPAAPTGSGGESTTSFSPTSPNAGMSVADQYASYGAGNSGSGISGSQADAARDSPGGGLY